MISKHVAQMIVAARDLHPFPLDDTTNPEYTRGQAELIIDAGGAEFLIKEEIEEFISRKTDVLSIYLKPGHMATLAGLRVEGEE